MFKKISRRNKGQNTAEYAILIALVVAAVIAMQTFVKRGLQGRTFAASKHMAEHTDMLGEGKPTLQYEPYYQTSEYNIAKDTKEYKKLTETESQDTTNSIVTRKKDGYEEKSYTPGETVKDGMIANISGED